jgi:hypothetical protein
MIIAIIDNPIDSPVRKAAYEPAHNLMNPVRRYDKHQAIDPSKNINKDLLDIGGNTTHLKPKPSYIVTQKFLGYSYKSNFTTESLAL